MRPERDDKVFMGGLETAQTTYGGLEVSAQADYGRDDSKTPLYDYTRHIVGMELGYRY